MKHKNAQKLHFIEKHKLKVLIGTWTHARWNQTSLQQGVVKMSGDEMHCTCSRHMGQGAVFHGNDGAFW